MDPLSTSLTPQDIIILADPSTNAIILDGHMDDDRYTEIYNNLQFKYYDDDELFGPSCHVCKEEILASHETLVHDGNFYPIIWKDDLKHDCPKDWDVIQCVFCLNFFHRNKCIMKMTNSYFLKLFRSKQWVCPTCVPEFVPSTPIIKFKKLIDIDKLMNKLCTLLNPLLVNNFESLETRYLILFDIRQLFCKIVRFDMNDPG